MVQADRYAEFVYTLPAFEWWRAVVDMVFRRYTGRSSYELPMSDRAWRRFWTVGEPAQRIGELLSAFVMELDRELAG